MVFEWLFGARGESARDNPWLERWEAIVRKRVPFYAKLPRSDQLELQGHVQVFLASKHFEGCNGLEVTEEMKVTVAAQACVLLLHRDASFRKVDTILLYPHAYQATGKHVLPDGSIVEGESVRLGESYSGGVVVLSWDDVVHGAACVSDGQNLVLHEFAHQLDQEDGDADGAPKLGSRTNYLAWARVLSREYLELREAAEKRRRTVLDKYGATNPAEFFAVATECFFEKPRSLQRKHPELYDELRSYYRFDPLALRERRKAEAEEE